MHIHWRKIISQLHQVNFLGRKEIHFLEPGQSLIYNDLLKKDKMCTTFEYADYWVSII